MRFVWFVCCNLKSKQLNVLSLFQLGRFKTMESANDDSASKARENSIFFLIDRNRLVKPDRISQRKRESKERLELQIRRNKGLDFLRQTKANGVVLIPARTPELLRCKCKLNCSTKFTKKSITELFEELYRTGDISLKRNFVAQFCSYQQTNNRYKWHFSLPRKASILNITLFSAFYLAKPDHSWLFKQ